MEYTIIDAHTHLWLRQDTVVDGMPIRTQENGRSLFMGEVRQMLPPFMTDGRNTAEVLLSNMDYAQVSAILKHPYVQTLSEEAKKLNKELTENNRFYPLPSELQRDGFLTVLFHPVSNNSELCNYLKTALQKVTDIYKDEENSEAFNQLYRESLFKTYVTMNRFYSLIEDGELLVQTGTLASVSAMVKGASGMSISSLSSSIEKTASFANSAKPSLPL